MDATAETVGRRKSRRRSHAVRCDLGDWGTPQRAKTHRWGGSLYEEKYKTRPSMHCSRSCETREKERGKGDRMKIIECVTPFIVAGLIIYCAYIGEVQCVSVLASSLALYAARESLRGGQDA